MNLLEVVDPVVLRGLFDSFSHCTGIAVELLDPEGKALFVDSSGAFDFMRPVPNCLAVPIMDEGSLLAILRVRAASDRELGLASEFVTRAARFIGTMAGAGRQLAEGRAYIRFLENLETVDRAIRLHTDLDEMLSHLMNTVFTIFGCDRAWLFFPCDPSSPTFRVPIEVARPQYPGAMILNQELPMPPDMAEDLRLALAADGPLVFAEGTDHPVNRSTADGFGVRSQMFMAIYPRVGPPWAFGMHQCSAVRSWTTEERRLFHEIGRRLADGLSIWLMFRELQESEARLRQSQKMEALGRLAGGIAHDFNNMLGVIIGNTDLAMDEVPARHAAHELLTEIRSAADHSAELTRQLLSFSRRQIVVPQAFELNDGVAGLLGMLRHLIGEGIELEWRPGEPGGTILLGPSQLDQILINLCANARDAIPGSGRIVVSTEVVRLSKGDEGLITGRTPGPYAVLTVTDDGMGMEPATLALIFDPFYTTKEPGKGTGLGLSTVFGVVEQGGGFIRVESAPGRGSTFRIFFPIRQTPADGPTRNPVGAVAGA